MTFTTPVTLVGPVVDLVPLAPEHHDGLVASVLDGELWTLWYATVPTPDGVAAEIDRRLAARAAGTVNPWTVVRHGGSPLDPGDVLGATTFLHVDEPNRHVEIGSTWLRASAQRTGANAAAKRLLLAYAFDDLGAIAVELRTHWMNRQSRAAIERLGAKLDGILRSAMIMPDGSVRDTAAYSILASEWPAVRSGLDARLAGR